MKSQTKMTITTFGAAAALAFAVGFGGLGASPAAAAPAPATHAPSSVTPANASAPGSIHQAVLIACISGLNC
ncbi:hypothetical protein [Mycobacterium montefiorense]|uniref:Uncharacterized protein n=1 Tax=Mycobacterium montefiorense TaxID=154654 RepID=A0AA37UV73_9MYCO|nr:hypothetical protein [Mycobacterium montefiorense]GBG39026.1 hypothetical protein MmonteBS_33980 [Mycobacterium montefiorense]GKU32814.1 hypothetical protein NJB14191_01610 [Mycobacterium montefiorense]GKU38335.1 hypothetical protein NJB14192_03330 [Mycobacterium montefiorense]GKU47248.1 hypothetical protein NJB14194_38660 [Mycobacterium montefiorense]GKU50365.1 hypothetical protein NJB14195_16110 [Mycobacterium montefiorense]